MKQRIRHELRRGIYLLPNLFTSANIALGVLSISYAVKGQFVYAAWAIIAAGFFDAFDGRIARLTNSESEFGVEYDSLADMISFGIAPAVLMYSWTLVAFPRFGWLAAFVYVCCAALRLARYNVQVDTGDSSYFYGLPTPAGAGMMSSTIVFFYHFNEALPAGKHWWALAMTIGLGLLMITTIRYRSFKQLNLRSQRSFVSLFATVGFVAFIAIEPQVTLFLFGIGYISVGLIEELFRLRRGSKLIDAEQRVDAETKVQEFSRQEPGDS